MDYKEIKKTLDSQSGKQLKDFLIQKTLELRDIVNIDIKNTNDKEMFVARVCGQAIAYNKLKEIMEQILTWEGQEIKKNGNDDEYSLPKKYY